MSKKGKGKKFFKMCWDTFWRPEMLVLPGQIAFFLFLSLVPTITLIGYACSYLQISNSVINTVIQNSFGKDIAELLVPILTSTKITPSFFITLGIGYFIASNGMDSIIVAANNIYGIKDSGFFRRRLKAILMEIIIVILFLFILVVPLLGENIIELLKYFKLKDTSLIVDIIGLLRGPVAWVLIFVLLKIIYAIAPDQKIPSYSTTLGSMFTTIGWVITTAIYSYYISHIANYSMFYGTLANIVILMVWVYFLSYLFVMGMAFNYHEVLEKTGIIAVQDVINENANIEDVYPAVEKKNKKKNKNEESVN